MEQSHLYDNCIVITFTLTLSANIARRNGLIKSSDSSYRFSFSNLFPASDLLKGFHSGITDYEAFHLKLSNLTVKLWVEHHFRASYSLMKILKLFKQMKKVNKGAFKPCGCLCRICNNIVMNLRSPQDSWLPA